MTDKTNDLMTKLTATDTTEELDKYLKDIENKYPNDLKSYLNAIVGEKGLTLPEVLTRSGLNKTYFYQIMNGDKQNPGRDKIIAIAIACEMNLAECQRALEIAKQGILYSKSRRDSVIIYAINKKMNLMDVNSILQERNLPIIETEKK